MDTLPANAEHYLPVLVAEVRRAWPDHPRPSTLAAQVENETCINLKWPSCWNPHTELKTSREYGFGLGQITITSKFNTFTTVQGLDPTLKTWRYEDRYNPEMQLRALVALDKQSYKQILETREDLSHLAMAYAAYNGGVGGVLSDRRVCSATPGCNPGVWFANVEFTSLKARSVVGGYGQSFFAINREYVKNVLIIRRGKYDATFKDFNAESK